MAKLSGFLNPSSQVTGSFNEMSSASQPRASYFVPSYNTSSTSYSAVFFDSEFNKISYSTAYPYYGSTGSYESIDTTYQSTSQTFHSVSASQSNTSSNSGFYLDGLWNSEYGSTIVRGSSRGHISGTGTMWPSSGNDLPNAEASAYVNSDHSRKDITVQLRNGALTASPLSHPWSGNFGETALPGSMRRFKNIIPLFPSGTAINSMYGSASYNAVRKELVVMGYNSSTTGRFDVAIWKNVDWDANSCDVTQLGTPTHLWNITTPSWQSTNDESRYNIKVVLVDNGDIYYSVMYSSNSFYLYKITRAVGDNSGSVETLTNQSLTTSYGKDQGTAYGQKAMSTRLGNMVVTYVPYYYYACGLRSYVIDKRNSSWENGRQSTSSSFGMNPLKYRDDSFAFILSGNYYAGNYSGISTMGFASPSQTAGGKPQINTQSWYLPLAPEPNTTNYVGVFQVWDYDLQSIPPAYSGRRA